MVNDRQKIEISLDRGYGKFIIASDYKSDYINSINISNNIKLTNIDPNKIDSTTPICYKKSNSNNADIYLLEENEYAIYFIKGDNYSELESFNPKLYDFFKKHNNDIYLRILNDDVIINFKSYAGKTFLDLVSDDYVFKIPIEVRSKKIKYDFHYQKMVEDLSDIVVDLLFYAEAPLYQSLIEGEDKETYYSDFILLTNIFSEENLPSIFEYLSQNLYSNLDDYTERVPIYLVSNLGPNELNELMASPQYLQETHDCSYSIFQIDGKGYLPLEITQFNQKNNINTLENQFFKFFLELLDGLISKLLKTKKEGYPRDELLKYSNSVNYFLSYDYFKDISPMKYNPLNSQVLQKKEGYRQILQYYLMLELGFKISWDDLTENFKSYQKKLNKLYEYWCYFVLVKILSEIGNINIPYEWFIDKEEKKWEINISKKESSIYPIKYNINGKEIKVKLMYDKVFNSNNNDFYSYSTTYRPDYTISLEFNNQTKYILFDAKYKANVKEFLNDENSKITKKSFKHQDIDKMHTYKDAIPLSIGAYILYPGIKKQKIYSESIEKEYYYGVGAFSLNPGDNLEEYKKLYNFIKNIIVKESETTD